MAVGCGDSFAMSLLRPPIRTHRKNAGALLAALAPCILLGLVTPGCTSWKQYVANGHEVGPSYTPPAPKTESQWIDAADPHLEVHDPPRYDWWKLFGDPALDRLISLAASQNPNLRVAAWRIEEAEAQEKIAVGELFPQQQTLSADYARRAVSANVANQVHNKRFFDQWTTGPALSWELDFWGLYRRAVEAADANFEASQENYNQVMVMLLADVGTTYIDLRTADQRLKYLRHNIGLQQTSLDISRQRFHEGATSELDVTQLQANVEFTESQIPPIEAQRRQAANRLCVLIGIPPRDVDDLLGVDGAIPSPPAKVAVGIPADLLRQRPDVRQAERELAAQSARIGIATAELYPHISITGNIGYDSSSLGNLFEPKSLTGHVGPEFRWDVLNYGRIVNGVRVQDSRFHELAWQYGSLVLTANEEAEDALVAFLKKQEELQSLTRSAAAAQQSVDFVMLRYREGLIDFNTLFTLELFLTERQDQLAQAVGAAPRDLILLYRALGGGWQVCPDSPQPVAAPTAEDISKPDEEDKQQTVPKTKPDGKADPHILPAPEKGPELSASQIPLAPDDTFELLRKGR